MKKLPTEVVRIGNKKFTVPKETAKAVLVLLRGSVESENQSDVISFHNSEVIRSLDAKFTRPGATLLGARIKEGLTQVELADKLKISQTNLSKMESGKRPIGKAMAKRIAKVLNIDYRLFL